MAEKRDLIPCSQEDEKRSGDPKIVFKRLTETLRFYKKGVKRMV
jgi:hypothetical protein